MTHKKGKFDGRITPIMLRVLNALDDDGDMTASDLAELLEVSESYVRQYGTSPLKDANLIRVSGWVRGTVGAPMRVFSMSSGKDAPRPARLPWTVTNKRWRDRHAAGLTQAKNSLTILAQGFRRKT